MNPFGYNLKSRCRNKPIFNRSVTRDHDTFGYNERSEVIVKYGGVGGLLAVSIDGIFSIPCYDHNGNIVAYASENGGIESLYVYDAYGNAIEKSCEKADVHSFGFSTKYHDREVSLIAYQKRFYRPDLGRWLNRAPIEEKGGENLYAFCGNNPILYYDINGCWAFIDNAIATIGGAVVGIACQAISNITSIFPFWFGKEFASYSHRESELPFDQHFLSALVAPRGLRFQIAFADTWANGVGACENYRETMKVYKLLGAEENFSIAFREGPHNHTPADWNHSLDFAQAFFERNGK